MGRVARHHAKGEAPAEGAADELFQTGSIPHAAVPEIAAEGDGIAMKIEDERSHHPAGRAADPEAHRQRQTGNGVNRIQLPIEQLLPNGGPSDLTTQLDMHTVLAKQIHVPGHQQRSAVNEGDEPDADWLDDTGESGL